MTALVWDQVGERRFETGIDRGVLFLSNGDAVPWNGLTLVTEVVTQEVKPYYLDGVKYLDHHVPGSYSGTLQAFTYPEELDELTGTSVFAPGVFVHDQRSSLFNLSYRTLVGNDVDGVDYGYKIHLLYNILAIPNDVAFDTLKATLEPKPFEWKLSGTPATMFGIRPTSHISIYSRSVNPALLTSLEEVLYGSEEETPRLPPLVTVLSLIEDDNWEIYGWPDGGGGGGGGGGGDIS